jgi:hypothetical protein
MKTTLILLACAMMLWGCGATVKPAVLTDNYGNTYPYAVIVVYQGVAVTTGFTTQAVAQSYADAVAKDPTKTVTLVSPKETK